MPARQLLLFPDPRPLVERLGVDFFRGLPTGPGVYFLRDAADTVIYVGKARNLRHRLNSYRVANPDRLPRRRLRLLARVERVTWEPCSDETDALRREAALLRELRPRFNRAGVWAGPRRHLAWRACPPEIEVAILPAPEEGWNITGPFGAQVVAAHRAVVRLLWCRLRPGSGLTGMPAGWFHGAHGPRVKIAEEAPGRARAAADQLPTLLNGATADWTSATAPDPSPFGRFALEAALTFVAETFGKARGPARAAS